MQHEQQFIDLFQLKVKFKCYVYSSSFLVLYKCIAVLVSASNQTIMDFTPIADSYFWLVVWHAHNMLNTRKFCTLTFKWVVGFLFWVWIKLGNWKKLKEIVVKTAKCAIYKML